MPILLDAELVIFDMYGTLVYFDPSKDDHVPRLGAIEILGYLKERKKAISSDSGRENIVKRVDKFFPNCFNRIYGEGAGQYKNLGQICKDLDTPPEKAVMIGDNLGDWDRGSAEHFGIPFILIPRDPKYSLRDLIPQ